MMTVDPGEHTMSGGSSSGVRLRLVLPAGIVASSLVGIDGVMTPVALPAIAEDLDAGLAIQQWVVAAFLLALGSLLLVGGSLGDAYGRWRIFGIGTAGFGIAALLSAVAPNAELLIVGRLLQGASAALLVPSVLAVITTTFHGEQRTKAISTWTAWSGLSVIVGPAIGGVLVDWLGWRSVFAVTVPLAGFALFLIHRAAPDEAAARAPGTGARVDVPGALLGIPAVGAPVYALIQGPGAGWTSARVLGAVAVGLIAVIAFVWWERRTAHPLVPFSLFGNRDFAMFNLVTFVLYASFISCGVYTIMFLQQTAGYAPATAGLAAVVPIIVLFFLSNRVGAVTERFGARLLIGGGAAIVGVAILLLLRADAEADFLTVVLPSVLLHGIGLTMVVAPLTAGVLAAADESHAGVASGINNAVARIGSLLGVAVVGMLISVQFSASVDDGSAELGPTAQRAAEDARGLPLAVSPPDDLAAGDQRSLTGLLETASLEAFRLGVIVIGGLALLGAVLALVGLRGRHRRCATARSHCASVAGHHTAPMAADMAST